MTALHLTLLVACSRCISRCLITLLARIAYYNLWSLAIVHTEPVVFENIPPHAHPADVASFRDIKLLSIF